MRGAFLNSKSGDKSPHSISKSATALQTKSYASSVSDAVICLDNLTVRYGNFVAVDGLSLTLRRGELFGLLGPNGAGKSSTLRVLTGQRKPAGGRVTVAGLDIPRDW